MLLPSPRILSFATTLFIVASILWLSGCGSRDRGNKPSQSWTTSFRRIGTLSSPALTDLNGDGVLDVVLGAGSVEFHPSDSGVLALDGNDGTVLWMAAARDQMFGLPRFMDVNADGVPDVFISGRAAELRAISGRNGALLWEYYPFPVDVAKSDSGVYNFYNPQFIPDQDGDGIDDILVAAGGYVKARPHDPDRPPGRLLVISSARGKKLASALMPDGKEIYMSVVVCDFRGNGNLEIVYGTGGETISGGLYRARLEDLLKNDLSRSELLASGEEKGFVAPPVLTDITDDGIPDIIANAVNGRMLAIDGDSGETLWTVSIGGTEAYCSIATGFFTDDETPDFFTNFGVGVWPDLHRSVQFMVDGKTGEMLYRDSLGTFQESSPVAVDYNGDGYDDVVFSINVRHRSGYSNRLVLIDFRADSVIDVSPARYGANVSSTPWVGDVDGDARLDLIYCHEVNPFDLLSVTHKQGMNVIRIKTDNPIRRPVRWGGYMGSAHDGIFRATR